MAALMFDGHLHFYRRRTGNAALKKGADWQEFWGRPGVSMAARTARQLSKSYAFLRTPAS